MMKHQLSAVNLCVLVVICVTVLLQLVSCLDPPSKLMNYTTVSTGS